MCASFLPVFNSPSFFYYPWALSFVFLLLPLSFLPFLPEPPSFLILFLSLFPLKLSGPRLVARVSYYSVLDTTASSGAHVQTLSWCPKAGCALIETNGEITQGAVPNNSLHSHLSGSMLPCGRMVRGVSQWPCQYMLEDWKKEGMRCKIIPSDCEAHVLLGYF